MPDYREKTFWFNGSHSCGYAYAGYAPNITGITQTNRVSHDDSLGGCFYRAGTTHSWYGDNIHTNISNLGFDASRSSYIYGNSHDSLLPDDAIVPRSLSCRGLIKYI